MSDYYPLTNEEVRLAKVIAKKAVRKWRTVEYDDCNSNLLLFMLEPKNLAKVIEYRDTEGTALIYTMLNNEANRFCKAETKANVHAELDVYNFYSEARLSRILTALAKIDFTDLEMNADTNSVPYTVAADVISVYNGLPAADKQVLELRFKYDLTGEALAKALDTTENNASQRVHRSLEKLRFNLSGEPSVWVPDRKDKYRDIK